MGLRRRAFCASFLASLTGGELLTGTGRRLARRNSLRFIHSPEVFLDPAATDGVDIKHWIRENYECAQSSVWGAYDVVTEPAVLLERGSGDCVDLSCLAASWILENTGSDVQLVLFRPTRENFPEQFHATVWSDTRMYDSWFGLSRRSVADFVDVTNWEPVYETSIRNQSDS